MLNYYFNKWNVIAGKLLWYKSNTTIRDQKIIIFGVLPVTVLCNKTAFFYFRSDPNLKKHFCDWPVGNEQAPCSCTCLLPHAHCPWSTDVHRWPQSPTPETAFASPAVISQTERTRTDCATSEEGRKSRGGKLGQSLMSFIHVLRDLVSLNKLCQHTIVL